MKFGRIGDFEEDIFHNVGRERDLELELFSLNEKVSDHVFW
jgi:hypothetical protein